MSRRRLIAIARKEFTQIWRDTRSLMIVLLMPIMLMGLLGYGTSLDAKHIPVYVFDREGSQDSQALLKRFQASEYFDLVTTVNNYQAIVSALDAGRCRIGLVIPWDFSKRLRSSGGVSIQALIDASDDNSANLAIGYAQAVVGGFSRDVQLDWISRQGQASETAAALSVEARTWFNEELESKNFIVPGVVVMVMAMVGALLSSLTIAREWERGSMEQLISTPVTPAEILLGKLLPYFVIGLFETALCAAIGVWWFEVPFRGTLITLFVTSALFLVATLGVGFWFSVATKNQLMASQLALMATLLPSSLLSGFTFPIDQMPAPIRAVTYLVSSRYYVTILKSVFLKGTGVGALTGPVTALAIYACVIGFLAMRSFHKTLD